MSTSQSILLLYEILCKVDMVKTMKCRSRVQKVDTCTMTLFLVVTYLGDSVILTDCFFKFGNMFW